MSVDKQLISVDPEELKFQFEPEKQCYCDIKVANNTQLYVAFKVKTTSPKKYFVRPNSGLLQPWDSSMIRVTLHAQREYPLEMQCRDKFLLQSTTVQPHSEVDELPPDTFNKEGGKKIQERKLRVIYVSPQGAPGDSEEEAMKRNSDGNALQCLKDERDSVFRQTSQLQQELDMLKRRKNHMKGGSGFSFTFAILVAFVGIIVGFLLKIAVS